MRKRRDSVSHRRYPRPVQPHRLGRGIVGGPTELYGVASQSRRAGHRCWGRRWRRSRLLLRSKVIEGSGARPDGGGAITIETKEQAAVDDRQRPTANLCGIPRVPIEWGAIV